MKIVHVIESFAGGSFDFLIDLIKGMPDYHHVVLHGWRENTPAEFSSYFPKTVTFINWKSVSREINPIKDLKALKELLIVLNDHRNTNIIHLHSSKAGFLGRAAARYLGLSHKVIYTPHGVSFLRKDVSFLKHNIFVALERIGSKFGGKTIACSKSEMEMFHHYGLSASYIYNGIACEQDEFTHNLEHGTKDKIRIGTVGRIKAPKNPSLFNKIALHFVNEPTIKFVWVGDGELKEQLTAPNIEITGWLTRNEVDTRLKNIDIYISTSLWEGLPLSVLQAMCSGKPLILSNCVGNKDLVGNGVNGRLFNDDEDAKNAIVELLENPSLIRVYGTASKDILMSKFMLDKTISEYRKLYSLLV